MKLYGIPNCTTVKKARAWLAEHGQDVAFHDFRKQGVDAAWLRDVKNTRTTKEAAMAKWTATESAQQVIDAAVQLFGGLGVTRGQVVERLYREIRALRIYEGATEVQKLIVAREILRR